MSHSIEDSQWVQGAKSTRGEDVQDMEGSLSSMHSTSHDMATRTPEQSSGHIADKTSIALALKTLNDDRLRLGEFSAYA